MKVMLDTNICIYLIKQKPASVLAHFEQYALGEIGISSISVAELQFGVSNSQKQQQNQTALDLFLAPLEIVDFDVRAAQVYGRIRAHLAQQGSPIGAYDMLIAAHAQSLDVTLVTNNLREFSRVPKLRLENWAD